MVARRWLPLSRRDFGRHTPREVREMIDGACWRDARAQDARAWQTAHLMNATGNYSSRVQPEDLLGRELVSPDARLSDGKAMPDADLPTDPTGDKARRGADMVNRALAERALRDRGERGEIQIDPASPTGEAA